MLALSNQCLQIIRRFDLTCPLHQQFAVSVIKKAIAIALNLSRHPIMQSKSLLMFPQLKESFGCQLTTLLEGLKLFVPAF